MTIDIDRVYARAEAMCLAAVLDPTLLDEYHRANTEALEFEHTGWKRNSGMRLQDKILTHFKEIGNITVREALVEYSVPSLTKIVSNLRKEGHDIESQTRHHPMTGQRYVRYQYRGQLERTL